MRRGRGRMLWLTAAAASLLLAVSSLVLLCCGRWGSILPDQSRAERFGRAGRACGLLGQN